MKHLPDAEHRLPTNTCPAKAARQLSTLALAVLAAAWLSACGSGVEPQPVDTTMSDLRQFAVAMKVYAMPSRGRWLPGVDADGNATEAYNSAAVIEAVVQGGMIPPTMVAPSDDPPPSTFSGLSTRQRIEWLRAHALFDIVLPADPADWHLRDDLDPAAPMLVLRGEPNDVTVIVVFMDGTGRELLVDDVDAMVQARAGQSLADLREANYSDNALQ